MVSTIFKKGYFFLLYSFFVLFCTFFSHYTYAYSVIIPPNQNGDNYTITEAQTKIEGKEQEIYVVLNFVNDHLRFFIIVGAFVALVFMGIKIITTQDDKKQEIIKNTLLGIGIGIFLAIFAYALVRLVTNIL